MPKNNIGGKRIKTIDGSPAYNTGKAPEGYHFWNIGKNAPKGYIGLIKNWGEGKRGDTAYLKTKYAEEVANFDSDSSIAMNYEKITTLNSQITKIEKQIANLRENGNYRSTAPIKRREIKLEKLRRVKKIREDLGL